MKMQHMFKFGQKFLVDNAPAALTVIGIVGTGATAFLTGRAAYQSHDLLHDAHELKRLETRDTYAQLTPREKVQTVWQLYVPAVGVGCLTVGCIFFSNRISAKRLAALASAYAITDKAYDEYKDKVEELFGKKKEEEVRAAVAQDNTTRHQVGDEEYEKATGGAVRCQDAWSKRYFWSDMETIKAVQNSINHQILNYGYATLADFYSELRLEATKEAHDIGWNSDKLMEITFTSTLDNESRPVLVMDFAVAPVRSFFRTK